MNFVCPKCGGALVSDENRNAKCKQNHTYDRARAGYLNLALSSAGGTHGDNAEMVEARRKFLDTGAYFPLAKRVSEKVLSLAESFKSVKLLDIGCGEGYYTDIIERELDRCGATHSVSGFDISREAVRRAARRNGNLELAVASAYRMPTAESSFDIAVNMFSPLVPSEILRALNEGGFFVMTIPAENHLFALKELLYKTPYKNEVSDSAISGFELISSERLSYEMNFENPEEIWSLFKMTPYAYRTRPADAERIKGLEKFKCEADFVIFVYKKQ